MKSITGTIACGVLGGALFAVSISAPMTAMPYSEQEIQPKFRSGAVPQRQVHSTRVWERWNWRKLRSVGSGDGSEGLAYAHMGPGDSLMVYDAINYTVRRISPGAGLPENIAVPPEVFRRTTLSLTDLAPAEDGSTIWACNPNGSITGFDRDGGIQYTLPRTIRGMRLAVFKDRLITTLAGSEYLFGAYTRATKTIAQFGEFLDEQSKIPILTDGWLAADTSQQAFYYAPRYDGFLASYKLDGTPRFLIQTVESLPLPKRRRKADGLVLYPTLLTVISCISARAGKLYVLVNHAGAGGPGTEPSVLDIYSTKDGSYLSSAVLPCHYTEIALGRGAGYTLGPAGVDVCAAPPADRQIQEH